MTKPVGGNGWQAPNKPAGSLDERVPELRRPSSLSPLRARRRSVVSVLTGGDGNGRGASGWRETKIDWLPDLSCINYTALLYFFRWSMFGICCISFAVSNVEFRCQKEEEKLHIFFFVLSWLTFHLSCPRLPPRCYGTPKTQCFGGEINFCLHNITLELPTLLIKSCNIDFKVREMKDGRLMEESCEVNVLTLIDIKCPAGVVLGDAD